MISEIKDPPSLENLIDINRYFKVMVKADDRNIFCSYNDFSKYAYDLYERIEEVRISDCLVLNIPYDKQRGRIKYLSERAIRKLQEHRGIIYVASLSQIERGIIRSYFENPAKEHPNIRIIADIIIIYPGDINSVSHIGPVINDEEKIFFYVTASLQEQLNCLDFLKNFFK